MATACLTGFLGEAERYGAPRNHREAGVRGSRARVLQSHTGEGRALAGLGVRRAFVRSAFQYLREPGEQLWTSVMIVTMVTSRDADSPVGHGFTEGKVPARPRRGEEGRQSGNERAGKRQRRRQHEAPRRQGRRRMEAERIQVLVHCACPHFSGVARTERLHLAGSQTARRRRRW